MQMKWKILVAVVVEIGYAVFTRVWLSDWFDGVALEVAVTAARLATIPVYWILFRSLILGRPRRRGAMNLPLVLAGSAVALSMPLFFFDWDPGGGLGTAIVFMLTSFVVGFREELLYRAVLLNLLEPRIGVTGALLLSTAIFVVYHYGAMPMNASTITEIACMSLLLGLIYVRSGSLMAVALLHSVYDALWFVGTIPAEPLADEWRVAFLLPALLLVLLGTWRLRGSRV